MPDTTTKNNLFNNQTIVELVRKASSQRKLDSRELGLIIGVLFSPSGHLHFGYWDRDLKVAMSELAEAQHRYAKYVIKQIPKGAKSVLDVGCGTGLLAEQLVKHGYRVECLSPSEALNFITKSRLGEKIPVHLKKFEDYQGKANWDVVLFSESFQYVPLAKALNNAIATIKPNGSIIICDFFRNETPDKSPLRGGHKWLSFENLLKELPLQLDYNKNITAETAPTMNLVKELLEDKFIPITQMVIIYLNSNYLWLTRLLGYLLKKRLKKLEKLYFSGRSNAATFTKYKTYRCLRLSLKNKKA